ncbi:MAG: SusD/RagB family nutrient-binding outer membrane lipoprotein [Bacteroidales bacterium]
MRHIFKILLTGFLVLSIFACEELPENVDPKQPEEANSQSLFLNAQINLVDYVSSINQNLNNSRLLAQYAAQTTYTDESRYNFLDRQFNDALWDLLYHNVLFDLKEARAVLEKEKEITAMSTEQINNRMAAIDVLEVYAYHVLVDQFGNVPYTEALQGADDPTPAYDDAQAIYEDLINRLNDDLETFDVSGDTWGDYDWFYSGATENWIYFANSLKLRLAMRVADVSEGWETGDPQTWAEDAIEDGVFPSQETSVKFTYPGTSPNIYTIYEEMIEGGRKDFVPANTIVDLMNSLEDPRRYYYLDPHTGDPDYFEGGEYGSGNTWGGTASYFDQTLKEPDYTFTLIDYVEVEFLLAEADERGYNVDDDAQTHYENAITASILDWGGNQAEVISYLSNEDVDYDNAPGDWRQKIGTQKYIALFDRGVEAWAEWRRLDYPEFNPPPGMDYSDIPVRQPYPFDEDNLNLQNYEEAAAAIGGDEVSTRLFWDTEPSPFL